MTGVSYQKKKMIYDMFNNFWFEEEHNKHTNIIRFYLIPSGIQILNIWFYFSSESYKLSLKDDHFYRKGKIYSGVLQNFYNVWLIPIIDIILF